MSIAPSFFKETIAKIKKRDKIMSAGTTKRRGTPSGTSNMEGPGPATNRNRAVSSKLTDTGKIFASPSGGVKGPRATTPQSSFNRGPEKF